MSKRDVVVLAAARSAIGTFGGSLADIEPAELAGQVMKATVERSGVDPKAINYVTVGNVIPTESRFAYVARVASIQAGLPMDSVAMAVNRLCSSGLQAIVTTSQNILLGDCDYGVGGGVEVMSRGAYLSTAMRSGARMGDVKMLDSMVATLTDPFGVGHMGVTAENLAVKWGITREQQDALAVESHHRAAAAIAEGRFKGQIVPIVQKTRKGEVTFDTDEHVKPGTTLETLAKLKPAFKKDGGTVTAGNASGINDGAAFFVLADAAVAAKDGHKPMARLVSYAVAGVPNDPGLAPGAEEGRPVGRPARRGGKQRGLRGAGHRRVARAGAGPGQDQPERRRHRAGPPDRLFRRLHRDEGAVRAAAHRRPLRAGDDVHRRRAGHCRRLRAALRLQRPVRSRAPGAPGAGSSR
jgi:acetyl-CoA C-acetyltransferase